VASPPAKCRSCGLVFPATAIGVSNSQVLFRGSKTNCPRCDGVADIGDGVYAEKQGEFELRAGPASSHAMMERLYGLAKRAKEEDLSAKEILAEVADINPELAKKLEKKPLPVFILLLVILLIVKHFEIKADISLDINHVIDQAYHLSKHEDPEQHLDEVAKELHPKPNESARPANKESRQVRRHKARQAGKSARPQQP
jgi:hypothetical protein